jgi:hypothetical protein
MPFLNNCFSVVGYRAKDFLALSATALKIFIVVAYSALKMPFLNNFLALSATALKIF